MKKLFLLLFLVAFAGCTTASLTPLQPQAEDLFKPYPVNTVMERSLGEQMIGYDMAVSARVYPGFIARQGFDTGGPLGHAYPRVRQRSEWVAVSETEDGNYLVKNTKEIMRPEIGKSFGGAPINAKYQICLIVKPKGTVIGTAICKLDLWTRETSATTWMWKKKEYEKVMTPIKIAAQDYIKSRTAAIIYVGKSGDTIRLIYRETANKDIELTYDLSESNNIAVKDISFEILSATNSSIKYIIKTNPSDLKKKLELLQKKNIMNNRM